MTMGFTGLLRWQQAGDKLGQENVLCTIFKP